MKCKWWFSYIPRHVTKKSCRITWVVHHSCTLKCPQVQMAVNKRYIHCWHLFYPFSLSLSLAFVCAFTFNLHGISASGNTLSGNIHFYTPQYKPSSSCEHQFPVLYVRAELLVCCGIFLPPSQFSKPKWTSFYHNFWFNLSRTVLSCYVSVWISNIHATYAV